MNETRQEAIRSGVANAMDTVFTDKAMDAEAAFKMLEDFVSDGLSCAGLSDIVTPEDIAFAKRCWYVLSNHAN